MFSGIIPMVAKVVEAEKLPGQTQFRIDLQGLANNLKIDDSVAINGTCLTVVALDGPVATFTAIPQTLEITNLQYLKTGDEVNVELSLRYGDVIGGHLVQGHIDTVVEITDVEIVGDAWQVTFSLPKDLRNYVIAKGYIGLDGMSLTVHTLNKDSFSVALIPHTREVTIAKYYQTGRFVNLEVDMLAKYAENNWRIRNEQHQ